MCTTSSCSLRAMEVAAWTWESRALVLRAVLLGLMLSVFSLHLHLHSPSLSSFCVLWEADLQDDIKSSLALWLPIGSCQCKMPLREGEVRLGHFIHVISGSLWAGHMLQPKVSAPDWQPPLPCPLCVWVLITFRPSSNNEVLPAPTHPRGSRVSRGWDPLLCLIFYLPTALSTVRLYSSLENFLS